MAHGANAVPLLPMAYPDRQAAESAKSARYLKMVREKLQKLPGESLSLTEQFPALFVVVIRSNDS
jgi:hypothetical protein